MKNYICLASLFLLFSLSLFGQSTYSSDPNLDPDSKGILYEKEFAIDFTLHTNGLALAVNFGKIKTYYKTQYYHIQIGELKHPKEYRQNIESLGGFPTRSSRSFIFGKRNNLYMIRGGIGGKRYFSEKAKQKGLAVGMSYEFGPSLGITKPYYLELIRRSPDNTSNIIVSEKYSSENRDDFLERDLIYGASGVTRGFTFSELGFVPGAHAKIGAHFDWGAFDEVVKALEAGIMVDFFIRPVPIMVEVDNVNNRMLFINLYLTLQLGKRS